MAGSVRKSIEDVNLFILAHPDDEVAVAPILDRLVRERKQVRIIYLTDGQSGGLPAVRNAETVHALASLGIDASDACFAGHQNGIADGQLYRHFHDALETVEEWCRPLKSIAAIYTLAWEGGHPDHDAAQIVAAAFAATRGLRDRVWQVPFYRASDNWPAPAFTLSSPLSENGPVVSIPLLPSERWLPVKLTRFYRSQWRSFAGLAPVILWHSLTRRALLMQRVRYDRHAERPTARPLLYEMRNGVRFDDFLAASAPFLASSRGTHRNDPSLETDEIRTA